MGDGMRMETGVEVEKDMRSTGMGAGMRTGMGTGIGMEAGMGTSMRKSVQKGTGIISTKT